LTTCRISGTSSIFFERTVMDVLENLTKEQLIDYIRIMAKNMSALDGVWFQSLEKKKGMDDAMWHDCDVWQRFTQAEARRIKKFLKLPEYPGLQGLSQALNFHFNSLLNHTETIINGNKLIYRIVDCHVQNARSRKGMLYHPCLAAGFMEYKYFASTIDSRINCEVISCFPEVKDPTCACAWEFTLKEDV